VVDTFLSARLSARILERPGDEYARNLIARENPNFRTNNILQHIAGEANADKRKREEPARGGAPAKRMISAPHRASPFCIEGSRRERGIFRKLNIEMICSPFRGGHLRH